MILFTDRPKKCHFKYSNGLNSIDTELDYGSVLHSKGLCMEIRCQSGVLDIRDCPRIDDVPEGCEIVKQELSKPFPSCCESVKCEN